MKVARVAVLVIALAAAGGAAFMANGMLGKKEPVRVVEQVVRTIATEEVLVAAEDVPLGHTIQADQLGWHAWPADALTERFITRKARPNAVSEVSGSVVRSPIIQGEPINRAKLVTPGKGGLLSAILPRGKRAVSIKISPATSAGGFILPNDKVDIILTRKSGAEEGAVGGTTFFSETILENIRVLAIDQTISEKDGKKVVVGKTATVELTPSQAERLAVSEELGELSLSLRSLADSGDDSPGTEDTARSGTVKILRYGVSSQVSVSR